MFSGRKTPAQSMTRSARNLEREKRPLRKGSDRFLLLVAEKTTFRGNSWTGTIPTSGHPDTRKSLLSSALSPRFFPSCFSLFLLFLSLSYAIYVSHHHAFCISHRTNECFLLVAFSNKKMITALFCLLSFSLLRCLRRRILPISRERYC